MVQGIDKEYIFNDKRTALVDGIYMKNHPIRKEMLKYVWGKYNMLPDVLTESLGRLYRAVAEVYIPPKNMKNLLDYTHDGSSVFSQRINEKNLTSGSSHKIAEISTNQSDNYIKWYEKYDNNNAYDTEDYWERRAADLGAEGLTGKGKREIRKNYRNERRKAKKNGKWYEVDAVDYSVFMGNGVGVVPKPTSKTVVTKSAIQINDDYVGYDEGSNEKYSNSKGLLKITSDLYKNNKIKTLVSRFHSDETDNQIEFIDTSKSRVGNSHGRNLLKKGSYTKRGEGDNVHGYDNPYCRVWTHHHQYKAYSDLIRSSQFILSNEENLKRYRKNNDIFKANTVLDSNGLVKITPNSNSDIKRCMFSITNLATRTNANDKGKTMWFPPYDIKFNESVNVDWNRHTFIGRGEPIYTYTQTTRRGTLSFTLLIDHPSIVNNMKRQETNNDNEDYENEILRFFAGCGKTDVSNEYTHVRYKQEKEIKKEGKEKIVPPKDGEELNFSVYFPNNYSGHMNYLDVVDSDWVDYLTKTYEIKGGVDNNNIKAKCDNKFYKYRVDKDRNECLSNDENYENSTNYNLNDEFSKIVKSNFNKIESIKSLKITGYAPNNKTGRDSVLAQKRASTVREYLEKILEDRFVVDLYDKAYNNFDSSKYIKVEYKVIELNNSNKINEKNVKENRKVDVKIVYNTPTIDNLSPSNENKIESRRKGNVVIEKEREPEVITQTNGYDYENEYTFFDVISETNEFALKTIKEKIKYFSPVYHSITPEGFNERLNFLHQCTRQGEYIGNNENKNIVAHNLAFGAPPFCELRIGDFIRTKMVIESMTINYDKSGGMQWDLNPEGAGVQPMFATISLTINIIGGQALDGAISMLNNAVSNNYYANTGAYKDAKFKKDETRESKKTSN